MPAGALTPIIRWQVSGAAGDPIPGARLFTMRSGTSTPHLVYTDAALLVPHANPVVADVHGTFPAIYLAPVAYRFRVEDAWGVTVFPDQDDVYDWGQVGTASGALGDNVTDDRLSIQQELDKIRDFEEGGGTHTLVSGKIYRLVVPDGESGLNVWDHITLNLNQSTLRLEMSGASIGVRLLNYARVTNGAIIVDSQDGLDDTYQSIYQSNLSVGAPYGANGTVAAPSLYEGVRGWRMDDLVLSSNREGGAMLVGYGGCAMGTIEDITFIGDGNTRCCVGFDCGWLGTLSSNDPHAAKIEYEAGRLITTHPQHITVRHLLMGRFTRATGASDLFGSTALRFSGCHHITVDTVLISGMTAYGLWHTGGDTGFEYAHSDDRPQAYQGMRFTNITLDNGQGVPCRYGAYLDTYGDNIWRAQYDQAYVPMLDPLFRADIVIEHCQFIGTSTENTWGIRTGHAKGITIRHCLARGWQVGVWFDEDSHECGVEDSHVCYNRTDGVLIGFTLREAINDNRVERVWAYGNGTHGIGNGIAVSRGHRHRLLYNVLGETGETVQARGIYIQSEGHLHNCQLVGNHVRGATAGAYVLESPSPPVPARFDAIGAYRDNSAALDVPSSLSGQAFVPTVIQAMRDFLVREWLTDSGGPPTEGSWYRGDTIRRYDATASATPGWDVTRSGTFGVLGGLTNVATTNNSPVVTMGLPGITATTTQASYTVTFSDVTLLRKGLRLSIPAAGLVNALLVTLVGTTGTLDVQAKATASGAPVITAGVIFGEVLSYGGAVPRTACVVKKVDGTSVTLSQTAGATESGLTASYTVPVFTPRANLGA
jgi:hypothetical protein